MATFPIARAWIELSYADLRASMGGPARLACAGAYGWLRRNSPTNEYLIRALLNQLSLRRVA
jgi:hypothetical protein